MLWLVASTSLQQEGSVSIEQYDEQFTAQYNLAVRANALKVNQSLGQVELAVLQLRAVAEQALGMPELFAGRLPSPLPFQQRAAVPPSSRGEDLEDGSSQAGNGATPTQAIDYPLDNPVYYSRGSGGALRKIIDDGRSAVFFGSRGSGMEFTRHDVQRLFATAVLDASLAEVVDHNTLSSRGYLLTADNLLRTYPFMDMGVFEDDKELTALPIYAWSQNKANQRGLVWAGPYLSRFSGNWVVSCQAEVNVGGRRAAIVGVELELSSFEQALLAFSLGRGAAAWLMDSDGLVLAGQEQAATTLGVPALVDAGLPTPKNLADEIKQQANLFESGNSEVIEHVQAAVQGSAGGNIRHHNGVVAAASRVDSTGWLLGGYLHSAMIEQGYQSTGKVESTARGRMVWVALIMLAAMLVGFLATWLEARRITQPLAILTQQVRQAAISRSPVSLSIADDSEIGALAAAIQELVDISFSQSGETPAVSGQSPAYPATPDHEAAEPDDPLTAAFPFESAEHNDPQTDDDDDNGSPQDA